MGGWNWNMSKAPLIGQFFENPYEAHQQEQFHRAAQAQQQYRPEVADASRNMLNQTYSLFQPMNRALGQMYGSSAMFDTNQATMNPMSPRMQEIGAPKFEKDRPRTFRERVGQRAYAREQRRQERWARTRRRK